GLVPDLLPALVVAVLLAPAGVAAGRLDVPIGARPDPDLAPGRGDGEGADTRQRLGFSDRAPAAVHGAEALACSATANADPLVPHVAEPRQAGGGLGVRAVTIAVAFRRHAARIANRMPAITFAHGVTDDPAALRRRRAAAPGRPGGPASGPLPHALRV